MAATPYDRLAPYYAEYARTRAAYCDAIDRLVLEWAPARVEAMLDVGSGDGSRAVRLAAALSASRLVLSDPSAVMVAQCRAHEAADVWHCGAEDLPAGPAVFDVVTCLWGVLGLPEGHESRVQALRSMAARLAPHGRLFLDVHNRYDAATAGAWRVLARMARDLVWPGDANGTVMFPWQVPGQRIESRGYLFTPGEMRRLCAAAGVRVVGRAFVDYATGRPRGRQTGQMFFALAR